MLNNLYLLSQLQLLFFDEECFKNMKHGFGSSLAQNTKGGLVKHVKTLRIALEMGADILI